MREPLNDIVWECKECRNQVTDQEYLSAYFDNCGCCGAKQKASNQPADKGE